MKNRYLFLSLIIITQLFACSDKNSVVNEVSLEGQLVKIDSANVGIWPAWMFGDNIYARDNESNLFSGKLTKTEWQKAEKVFVRGNGHNEFGFVTLSQDQNGALYVLNRPWSGPKLLSLTKISNTDSIAAVKDQTKWEKYDFAQLPPFMQGGDKFVVVSDSTILVLGAPTKDMAHVFSVVNFKNQTVTPLDYWPNDGAKDPNKEEKLLGYTYGSGIIGNGKGRYLYWNAWGMLAFIFTIDNTKTNILSHLYCEPIPHDGIPSTERVYCCSDNDKIYLLYKNSNSKGEKMETFDQKDPFPFGNRVEVYDWDGVKQQVIHLDKYGKSIMLSEDSRILYLYCEYVVDGSDPYIYSYDLSSLK